MQDYVGFCRSQPWGGVPSPCLGLSLASRSQQVSEQQVSLSHFCPALSLFRGQMADDAKWKAVHARVPPLGPLRPPLLMEPVLGGRESSWACPQSPVPFAVSSLWSSPCSLRMLGWQLNRHLRRGALGDECPLPLQGRGGAPSTATTRTG